MDLKSLLNDAQLEAATHLGGPVCILAGAGSGKTRVVTHRIAYLIHNQREHPGSICAVTFTNKAAGEMRRRVDELVPGRGRRVQVGTFHGTAAKWLRMYGDSVGVPPRFVIYDSDDSLRLLKRVIVEERNWSKELVRPTKSRIEDWQSDGLWPDELPEQPWDRYFEQAREAYAAYVERLATMGAVDFGGLLLKLRALLRLPAGEEVRRRVKHLLVDEYQDVNQVQADIVLDLGKTAETVAVVGDDDQAIYGWRGASADALKRFVDTVPKAKLVRLEDNYRSTATILSAANGIIAHNAARLGKVLRATGGEGRRVRVFKARDDRVEARSVIGFIQDHDRAHGSLEQVAILYRANALSRPFEDELRKADLPYRIIGGVRFYDRKEVKDVLATLRCALNPKSDVDTLRCIAAIPRGIGDTSLAKIQKAARDEELSVLEAMAEPALLEGAGVAKRARGKAQTLAQQLLAFGEELRPPDQEPDAGDDAVRGLDAREAVARASELSGVPDRLEAEGTIEAQGRLENLGALLDAAAQFVDEAREAEGPDDTRAFLEAASLLSGTEEGPGEERDDGQRVTLMTLHAAKGLEYDLVILVGLEEHGFPHSMALREDASGEALEEERRLAYVGITRARQRLILTWAQRRMVQGTIKYRQASRFLRELPKHALEGDLPPGPQRALGDMFGEGGHPSMRERYGPGDVRVEYDPDVVDVPAAVGPAKKKRSLPTRLLDDGNARPDGDDKLRSSFANIRARLENLQAGRHVIDDDRAAPEPGEVRVVLEPDEAQAQADNPGGVQPGARVAHAHFGDGTVVGLRGTGRRLAALVKFDDDNRPRVIIPRHLVELDEDRVTDAEIRVVLDEA